MSKYIPLTAEELKKRAGERFKARHMDKLTHYPEEEQALLLSLFRAEDGLEGMDAAIAALIRRNFIDAASKVGWQAAATAILDHAGTVLP